MSRFAALTTSRIKSELGVKGHKEVKTGGFYCFLLIQQWLIKIQFRKTEALKKTHYFFISENRSKVSFSVSTASRSTFLTTESNNMWSTEPKMHINNGSTVHF